MYSLSDRFYVIAFAWREITLNCFVNKLVDRNSEETKAEEREHLCVNDSPLCS